MHSEDLGSVKVGGGGGGDLPQYPFFFYLHRGVNNNQGLRCPYLGCRIPRSPKIFKG